MKNHSYLTHSVLAMTAAVGLLFAAGCGKQETPSSEKPAAADAPKPAAEPAKPAAAATPAPAAAASPAATATAPAPAPAASTVQQAVDAAATQAAAAAATATSQAQTLIDKAKGLVTDEKYKDALTVLQQLSNVKLTDEQQKLVDSLKAQIQTALANTAGTNAAAALNSILGGKK
jgi:hypothetical protein